MGKTSKESKKSKKGSSTAGSNKFTSFLKSKKFGFVLAGIQAAVTALFIGLLIYLNVVPAKYFVPVIFILVLFLGYDILSQFSKKFRTSGKIIAFIIILILGIGSFLLAKSNQLLSGISGSNKKIDTIGVYVKNDNPAKTLGDAADYNFGILQTIDRENTNNAISKINTTVGKEVTTTEFTDMIEMADALLNDQIQGIILNSAFIETIADDENHAEFAVQVRQLESISFTTIIKDTSVNNITTDPFTVYLSGIDVYGDISTTSRSDVNILATVNPKTKQVLLVSTPRDYYVQTTVSGGSYDKLTHAGIYGIDCSMGTLSNLYGLDVQYFFRINFTGFQNIIDALGGITVYSDVAFNTLHEGAHIQVGENNLSGKEALGFARERYALAGGDNDRGKNQMKVIKAVIDKACSPAILNNFSGLVDSVSGSFDTNMSSDEISSLVKMELSDMASWNVVQYAVAGKGTKSTTFSMPNATSYVMEPDYSAVETAKTLQQQVLNGEIIQDPNAAPAQ